MAQRKIFLFILDFLFLADRDLHRSQNDVARQQFANTACVKVFYHWKVMTLKAQAVVKHHRKKVGTHCVCGEVVRQEGTTNLRDSFYGD